MDAGLLLAGVSTVVKPPGAPPGKEIETPPAEAKNEFKDVLKQAEGKSLGEVAEAEPNAQPQILDSTKDTNKINPEETPAWPELLGLAVVATRNFLPTDAMAAVKVHFHLPKESEALVAMPFSASAENPIAREAIAREAFELLNIVGVVSKQKSEPSGAVPEALSSLQSKNSVQILLNSKPEPVRINQATDKPFSTGGQVPQVSSQDLTIDVQISPLPSNLGANITGSVRINQAPDKLVSAGGQVPQVSSKNLAVEEQISPLPSNLGAKMTSSVRINQAPDKPVSTGGQVPQVSTQYLAVEEQISPLPSNFGANMTGSVLTNQATDKPVIAESQVPRVSSQNLTVDVQISSLPSDLGANTTNKAGSLDASSVAALVTMPASAKELNASEVKTIEGKVANVETSDWETVAILSDTDEGFTQDQQSHSDSNLGGHPQPSQAEFKVLSNEVTQKVEQSMSMSPTERKAIVHQLTQKIEALAVNSVRNEVTVRMEPAELGTVLVQVSRGMGELTASLSATDEKLQRTLHEAKNELAAALTAKTNSTVRVEIISADSTPMGNSADSNRHSSPQRQHGPEPQTKFFQAMNLESTSIPTQRVRVSTGLIDLES